MWSYVLSQSLNGKVLEENRNESRNGSLNLLNAHWLSSHLLNSSSQKNIGTID